MTAALEDVRLRAARVVIEDEIERLIDVLDRIDAAEAEREPDGEDEVVCEDEGVVTHWMAVGRQA